MIVLLLKVLSNSVVLDLVVKLRLCFRSETIQGNYVNMNVMDFELLMSLELKKQSPRWTCNNFNKEYSFRIYRVHQAAQILKYCIYMFSLWPLWKA